MRSDRSSNANIVVSRIIVCKTCPVTTTSIAGEFRYDPIGLSLISNCENVFSKACVGIFLN